VTIDTNLLEKANREAIGRVLASEPWLVGVRPAREVVPALATSPATILHAAPPTTWGRMCPLLRGGVTGAATFEGLAASPDQAAAKAAGGEIAFAAAQDHGAMAGGVGSITASTPVMVLEDRAHGTRACHFLMEGFGRSLVLGMWDDTVAERLVWFREELGPALDAAIREIGGIDCRALMAEALRRGDELHNRNAAATSMLAERLAPGLVRAGVEPATTERAFALMRENPQFFVPVPLAAARLALDAADGVEGSSLLTACGANGRDCGIRVSGLPGVWFTAPAEAPTGVLFEGFGPDDAGPSCGDSLLVECWALGATVLPAAPALWPLLGIGDTRARRIHDDARSIALGEHPAYRIPALDAGAPVGVDVLRVAETGVLPSIDIVMVHPEPGLGAIGFGLTQPPAACFEQAALAFRERYS
jgi:hypothetical protein